MARGGWRPGAGRKPSGASSRQYRKATAPDIGIVASPQTHSEVTDLARRYTVLSLETLAAIAADGASDAARVAASKELLTRAWGQSMGLSLNPSQSDDEGERASPVTMGKKAAAEIAAQSAGSGTAWGDVLKH